MALWAAMIEQAKYWQWRGSKARVMRIRTPLSIAIVLMLATSSAAWAKDKTAPSARSGELIVPTEGIIRAGQGQRVEVADEDGKERVALVHAEVGDRLLVVLPNGQLHSAPRSETTATEEPFRAATKDEIASQLKRGSLSKFKSRATSRYVFVYNTSDEFTKGASRILESMLPGIVAHFKRQKFPVQEPRVPLVAIMFRTEEEFRAFEDVPEGMAAYYNAITNHIVMYEQSRLVEVAPELALKQAISTIAHEGTHQILHNIGVQQRLARWPMWTSEGLAEYFAPTDVGRKLKWKGAGVPHDLRMHELDKFMKRSRGKEGAVVEETVGAARLSSAGYASAWALTHYLATRKRDKFYAYLREMAQLTPLDPRDANRAAAKNKERFRKYFGDDYGKLEDGLVQHLQGLPYVDPIANQTHYVVMLQAGATRAVGVTSSPAAVQKWEDETRSTLPAAIQAQAAFDIMPFENKSLADEFAARWLKSR